MALNKNESIGKEGVYWLFACKGCGKTLKCQSGSLKNHKGQCVPCSKKKRPFEFIFNKMKKSANEAGKHFELTYDQYLEFTKIPECHYCTSEIPWTPHVQKKGSTAYYLDRKDNNAGYTKDNLVVCCWNCNETKGSRYSYQEFLMLAPVLKLISRKRKNG